VTGVRVLPGRAGRLRLRRQLAVADRGADLLQQRLQILRREEQRFQLLVERTEQEWARACREAEVWALRVALSGGQRAVRLASPTETARAEVRWSATMGVSYPESVRCAVPEPASTSAASGVAVHQAQQAAAAALVTGARHAAAEAAVRTLQAEVATTRRRLRAVTRRRIPELSRALAAVDVSLEEQEREDGARLRWAAGRRRLS
jgi:V/A-type H+-transporting ATPase subunit D